MALLLRRLLACHGAGESKAAGIFVESARLLPGALLGRFPACRRAAGRILYKSWCHGPGATNRKPFCGDGPLAVCGRICMGADRGGLGGGWKRLEARGPKRLDCLLREAC